ncbi:unnamed protein product [Linum trigynum]|uniref:Uncharacterized protein n=1 Tax=Linum trigynum TaxID=586398 RepID=A0AAV2DA13_9ROSI
MAEDYERSCRKASRAAADRWTPPPPTIPTPPSTPPLAVFCVVGGGLCNVAGTRLMLPVRCITYALYAWSFLYYNHSRDKTVIVVADGILGVGGGMLRSV